MEMRGVNKRKSPRPMRKQALCWLPSVAAEAVGIDDKKLVLAMYNLTESKHKKKKWGERSTTRKR